MTTPTRWPAKAVDDDATDLAAPTTAFLRKLYLLESEDDAKKGTSLTETPYSLQVITAGALDASKISATLAGVGGVGGAAAVGWAAFKAEEVAVRVTLVGAVAVILAAALLAIALIVRSDVRSRSDATVAQYGARAELAARFLTLAAAAQTRPAAELVPAAPSANGSSAPAANGSSAPAANGSSAPGAHEIDICGLLSCIAAFPTAVQSQPYPQLERVIGVRRHATDLQVRIESGGWISVSEVDQFTSL